MISFSKSPVAAGLALALLLPLLPAQSQRVPEAKKAPPWSNALDWRCVGPANMSGRIVALSVCESRPSTWYAASASGGLLKTINAGTTYEHLFDREAVVSIGDVHCAPSNPDIVWIGSGESNPRNSVSWGRGVYKSVDGGKTWKNMGLERSFQIGRVRIHPTNPDIVYVAALGRLYGPSEERGLYKTTDGGKTWERVLHIDERTGVMELVLHPENPDVMLAATYERQRDGFDKNDPVKKWGPGSGLHRSADGGKSWERVTKGLPSGLLGRIGLSWYRKNPDVVWAVVESDGIGKRHPDLGWAGISVTAAEVGAEVRTVAKKSPAAKAGIVPGDIIIGTAGTRILGVADFQRSLAPKTKGTEVVIEFMRDREVQSKTITLAAFPKDPRRGDRPFGTRLGGQVANIGFRQGPDAHEYGGIYRSEDQGKSWKRVNSLNPRPMYFSQIRVDPSDEAKVWVCGISLHRTLDGGKTFTSDGGRGVHADQHALWINPKNGQHLVLGNDGGIYVSHDGGANWDHHNHFVISQFYDVTVGPRRDYRIYGGLQDNGTWGGPSRHRAGGIINSDWLRIGGGDGFVCQVDRDDPDLIYYESQNGGLRRRHLTRGSGGSLRPRAPKGMTYRWNWQTPFILSAHNTKIWYTAGNYVFRSFDRGNRAKRISPEITAGERGSATVIAESPRDPDLLYVGTDDGALHVTSDGGANWTNLLPSVSAQPSPEASPDEGEGSASKGPRTAATEATKPAPLGELIPGRRWVSGLVASRFAQNRAYLTLDGHRSDDDACYVFMSEDQGKTWQSLAGSLPEGTGSARTIEEDLERENVLYLGTEFGAFVSIDRGATWQTLNANLPTVAVHSFAQAAQVPDLVVGTHGRGIWVLDVSWLRQLDDKALAARSHLFNPSDATHWRRSPSRGRTLRAYSGENPTSGARIHYRLASAAQVARVSILDSTGKIIWEADGPTEAGIQTVTWNLRKKATQRQGRRRRSGPRVPLGNYRVELRCEFGGESFTHGSNILVTSDPSAEDTSYLTTEFEEEAEEEHEQEHEEIGTAHN